MSPANLKTRFLRAFLLYTLDMVTAIAGWHYGFGLPIKNLFALVGFCLFLRFFWYLLSVAFIQDDARRGADAMPGDKDRIYEGRP